MAQFISGTWLPVAISGVIGCLILLPFAMRSGGARELPSSIGSILPAIYLCLVTATIVAASLLRLPPYISLGTSFLVGFLFTMRSLGQVFREFDFRSLATLYAFVASVTVLSILVMPVVSPYVLPAAQGSQPYSAVFIGITSNIISNVPVTQLVLSTTHVSASVAPRIAVEAGLAGNLSPVASFANILALQIARRGASQSGRR